MEEKGPWHEHGTELEPRAIEAIERKLGIQVERDFFCVHPNHEWMGASPDGFVQIDAGKLAEALPKWQPEEIPDIDEWLIEIKCRDMCAVYETERAKAVRGVLGQHKHQVQGQMLVTGCKGNLFVNYFEDPRYRDRRCFIQPILREEGHCKVLEEAAAVFYTEACDLAIQSQ